MSKLSAEVHVGRLSLVDENISFQNTTLQNVPNKV